MPPHSQHTHVRPRPHSQPHTSISTLPGSLTGSVCRGEKEEFITISSPAQLGLGEVESEWVGGWMGGRWSETRAEKKGAGQLLT